MASFNDISVEDESASGTRSGVVWSPGPSVSVELPAGSCYRPEGHKMSMEAIGLAQDSFHATHSLGALPLESIKVFKPKLFDVEAEEALRARCDDCGRHFD